MNIPIKEISDVVKVAKETGALDGVKNIIQQIWYITLGHKLDFAVEKTRLEQNLKLEQLKNDLEQRVAKIPEENKQEAKVRVVGPVLEASKFYMEEAEIRQMFAQLIASSMNKEVSDSVHPSFIEIIKMMSVVDAKTLYYLYKTNNQSIANIVKTEQNGTYVVYYRNVYLANEEIQEHSLIEPTIDNLIRLGLVQVSYSKHLVNDELYQQHYESSLYVELDKNWQSEKTVMQKDILILQSNTDVPFENRILTLEEKSSMLEKTQQAIEGRIELQKGSIELTALGMNFCKTCLPFDVNEFF